MTLAPLREEGDSRYANAGIHYQEAQLWLPPTPRRGSQIFLRGVPPISATSQVEPDGTDCSERCVQSLCNFLQMAEEGQISLFTSGTQTAPPPNLSSPRCVLGFRPFAVFPLGSLICPLFPLSNPGDFPSNSPATPAPSLLVFWHRGSAYLCLQPSLRREKWGFNQAAESV